LKKKMTGQTGKKTQNGGEKDIDVSGKDGRLKVVQRC